MSNVPPSRANGIECQNTWLRPVLGEGKNGRHYRGTGTYELDHMQLICTSELYKLCTHLPQTCLSSRRSPPPALPSDVEGGLPEYHLVQCYFS